MTDRQRIPSQQRYDEIVAETARELRVEIERLVADREWGEWYYDDAPRDARYAAWSGTSVETTYDPLDLLRWTHADDVEPRAVVAAAHDRTGLDDRLARIARNAVRQDTFAELEKLDRAAVVE